MKSSLLIVILSLLLVFAASSVIAQELMIYPAQGQSQDQKLQKRTRLPLQPAQGTSEPACGLVGPKRGGQSPTCCAHIEKGQLGGPEGLAAVPVLRDIAFHLRDAG